MTQPTSAVPTEPTSGRTDSTGSLDSTGGPPSVKVPYRWRNLSVLTGATVVDNTENSLTSTLFPAIAAALRLDSGHLGTLAALGKLVSAPAGPLWVWLASRTSRKLVLVLTSVLGGIFGIAAGFAQDFVQLLILNTLLAASIIGAAPIANAVIMDSFDDRSRGRAISYYYGAISAMSAFLGPALALFTRDPDGWRYGLFTVGVFCLLAALAQALVFKDPGVGASEAQLTDLSEERRVRHKVSARDVLGLFRVPTFSIMMASRLLSGHLLIGVFGVQFLVTERGFDNATAAVVLIPFGVGYVVGTLGGGWIVGRLDAVLPSRGRVVYIQAAQVAFALAAFFGTQFDHERIGVYGVFWALMGIAQGLNPPVNRPIVASVIVPELRGQAFAIFITVFETIGWAIFSLGAGQLANSLGIQAVFLWILVGLMLVNALLLGALYRVYPRDVRRVEEALTRRRQEALSS
jgi:predicted MFS family arabinose efflux permease